MQRTEGAVHNLNGCIRNPTTTVKLQRISGRGWGGDKDWKSQRTRTPAMTSCYDFLDMTGKVHREISAVQLPKHRLYEVTTPVGMPMGLGETAHDEEL